MIIINKSISFNNPIITITIIIFFILSKNKLPKKKEVLNFKSKLFSLSYNISYKGKILLFTKKTVS